MVRKSRAMQHDGALESPTHSVSSSVKSKGRSKRSSILRRVKKVATSPRRRFGRKQAQQQHQGAASEEQSTLSSSSSTKSDVVVADDESSPRNGNRTSIRTSILTSFEPTEMRQGAALMDADEDFDNDIEMRMDNELAPLPPPSCGAASGILATSFLFCGNTKQIQDDSVPFERRSKQEQLDLDMLKKADPTVQESIECVFASQLEEGLPHDLLWEDQEEGEDEQCLTSPSEFLQQRSSSRLQPQTTPTIAPSRKKPRKTFATGSLVHMGTYDPVKDRMSIASPVVSATQPSVSPGESKPEEDVSGFPPMRCARCRAGRSTLPHIPNPKDWPQCPLLFRPTPGSGTSVKAVRFTSGKVLWQPGSTTTWYHALREHWGETTETSTDTMMDDMGCPECMCLPVNNGNEKEGEALVIDFESPLWDGTLLMRLRYAEGTTAEPYQDDKGYFSGMNRKYQAVISGNPKQPIRLTACQTGLLMDRPFGKLPAKWMVKGALKVLSFFAPQLEAKLEGDHPSSLTPLGSTPQMLYVNPEFSMESSQEEPSAPKHSILDKVSDAPTTLARARYRKKQFDKLYMARSATPEMVPSDSYQMEFLQHLFDFRTFAMDLGSFLGQMPLDEILNGQPLQLMALCHDGPEAQKLWAFDVWHEALLDKAKEYELQIEEGQQHDDWW
eukprot:CAMPEP_0194050300 /NCGR_PEP_ID=MMETSP0009_2-20130614/34472_1 /TAXON_ID=210454 /ORGANISM="Grammatophora oceanica, Strain CCMP 410" /LENGTH=669 /DNA_ID=CAMNT_0038696847 /DNA_START=87 /DNA_END=2096 /DNA_ORIENTATION=+